MCACECERHAESRGSVDVGVKTCLLVNVRPVHVARSCDLSWTVSCSLCGVERIDLALPDTHAAAEKMKKRQKRAAECAFARLRACERKSAYLWLATLVR